jgi:hypothetical protein
MQIDTMRAYIPPRVSPISTGLVLRHVIKADILDEISGNASRSRSGKEVWSATITAWKASRRSWRPKCEFARLRSNVCRLLLNLVSEQDRTPRRAVDGRLPANDLWHTSSSTSPHHDAKFRGDWHRRCTSHMVTAADMSAPHSSTASSRAQQSMIMTTRTSRRVSSIHRNEQTGCSE